MKLVQVTLQNKNYETFTTWVDKRPDLKMGVWITLKDFKPDVAWRVDEMYETTLDSKDLDFHRKWDNNDYSKHDGLKIK